jgi:hypothetical protein
MLCCRYSEMLVISNMYEGHVSSRGIATCWSNLHRTMFIPLFSIQAEERKLLVGCDKGKLTFLIVCYLHDFIEASNVVSDLTPIHNPHPYYLFLLDT